MLDNRKRTKIKNNKIQYWRLELAFYSYTIKYRPGKDNAAADSLSRTFCGSTLLSDLAEIHAALCHPGITRLLHFVRTKNLPFSTDDVRKVCSNCRICAELKPSFYKPIGAQLIKATKPFERITIDFKGPVPSTSHNKYFLVIIDEYSRLPFIFPCSNMNSSTVIACFNKLLGYVGCHSMYTRTTLSPFCLVLLKIFCLNAGSLPANHLLITILSTHKWSGMLVSYGNPYVYPLGQATYVISLLKIHDKLNNVL